jgi:hypothetical protein
MGLHGLLQGYLYFTFTLHYRGRKLVQTIKKATKAKGNEHTVHHITLYVKSNAKGDRILDRRNIFKMIMMMMAGMTKDTTYKVLLTSV